MPSMVCFRNELHSTTPTNDRETGRLQHSLNVAKGNGLGIDLGLYESQLREYGRMGL